MAKTTRGVNFLIYVKKSEDSNEFVKVAGQQGGTLSREYDTIDVTSKDNMGWEDNEYGNASWEIEGDGILVEDDEGFKLLEDAFENADYVMARFETQAGNKYQGMTIISEFEIEAPHDDTATYDITLEGKGAYERIKAAGEDDDKLDTPEDLEDESVSYDQVELKWESVDDADEYTVYRDGNSIATTEDTKYTDTEVESNKEYKYKVRAKGEGYRRSDKSDELKVKTDKNEDEDDNDDEGGDNNDDSE